jgi:photosystem II stability/assembly factor-like uncharacterized protein
MVVVLGCALAAGCGASQQSAASAHTVATRHGGACAKPASLPAGVSVAPWRLGSVLFASARAGAAVTSSEIPCVIGPGGLVGQQQPVRLAVTDDGGRHWMTEGSSLPVPAQHESDYQVAAVSGSGTWIFSRSADRLIETRDGGATWTDERLPQPVLAVTSAGGWLWALSCPGSSQLECVPVVERMKLPAGPWTRTRSLTSVPVLDVQLSLVSGDAAVISLRTAKSSMLASTIDGGAHWSVRPAPTYPGFTCVAESGLFTTAGSAWWQLCGGGNPGMQGANTALLRSDNAGRTWTAVAVSIVGRPAPPGALPVQAQSGIAAYSATGLFLGSDNQLYVSADGGKFWSTATSVNLEGAVGQFDVLPGTATWLLGPGTGLWQTTNGKNWHALGALDPA